MCLEVEILKIKPNKEIKDTNIWGSLKTTDNQNKKNNVITRSIEVIIILLLNKINE